MSPEEIGNEAADLLRRDAVEPTGRGAAAVIAGWVAEAVAAERERCARVAEATETEQVLCGGEDGSYWESDAAATRAAIARNIRATPPTGSDRASSVE